MLHLSRKSYIFQLYASDVPEIYGGENSTYAPVLYVTY